MIELGGENGFHSGGEIEDFFAADSRVGEFFQRQPAADQRRGNGVGKGDGWGGPAKGASTAPRFNEPGGEAIQALGNDPAKRASREERLAAMKDKIYALATGAQREETQLSAAVAFLNQELGMPIQRSINANVDDPAKVVIITGVTRAGDASPD